MDSEQGRYQPVLSGTYNRSGEIVSNPSPYRLLVTWDAEKHTVRVPGHRMQLPGDWVICRWQPGETGQQSSSGEVLFIESALHRVRKQYENQPESGTRTEGINRADAALKWLKGSQSGQQAMPSEVREAVRRIIMQSVPHHKLTGDEQRRYEQAMDITYKWLQACTEQSECDSQPSEQEDSDDA